MSKFLITSEVLHSEYDDLYRAIGKAVSEWASLEFGLSVAFSLRLGMGNLAGYHIFFSARSFRGKRDILVSALRELQPPEGHPSSTRHQIFMSACKKADKWSSVRNKIAHEMPFVSSDGDRAISGIEPHVSHKDSAIREKQKMLKEHILESAANFEKLFGIIMLASTSDPPISYEEVLLKVRGLPAMPYSG